VFADLRDEVATHRRLLRLRDPAAFHRRPRHGASRTPVSRMVGGQLGGEDSARHHFISSGFVVAESIGVLGD